MKTWLETEREHKKDPYLFVAVLVEDRRGGEYEDPRRAKLLRVYDDRTHLTADELLIKAACMHPNDIVCVAHCTIVGYDKPD